MMSRQQVKQQILARKLVPVIRAPSAEVAAQVVNALCAGGLDVVEITMTVPGALDAMRAVATQYGDRVLLGAGTVLDAETARLAILAGAKFIVSPSLDEATLAMAHRYAVATCPGCLTPTEIVRAWQAGADFVKVFPCDAVGGAKYIKAIKGPLPQVDLIPTGGVNLETAADFIAAGAGALGVGSALVSREIIADGNWDRLTDLTAQYLQAVGAQS